MYVHMYVPAYETWKIHNLVRLATKLESTGAWYNMPLSVNVRGKRSTQVGEYIGPAFTFREVTQVPARPTKRDELSHHDSPLPGVFPVLFGVNSVLLS